MEYWVRVDKTSNRKCVTSIEEARKIGIKVLESRKEVKPFPYPIYKSKQGLAIHGVVEKFGNTYTWIVANNKGYSEYTLDKNGKIAHVDFGISRGR